MASPHVYVLCPVCGARSRQPGFGCGLERVISSDRAPLSADPTITRRRARAAAIRAANASRNA